MAIKLTDIARLTKEALNTASTDTTLNKVGEELVDRIKVRTRLGKGVKSTLAAASPVKKITTKTVGRRKRLKKSGELTGPNATPARSGLNRSGQMLNSIKHKANAGELEITLDEEGQRKAEDLIEISEDNTFMNISKAEFKSAVRTLESIINKKIRSLFN